MITLRRAKERHHSRRRKQEIWRTFHADGEATPLVDGFGALEVLDEGRIPPGAGVPRFPYHDAEIITYVREGALAYEDSKGHSGVVYGGEFQRRTVGRRSRYSETNASRTDGVHIFQLWLRPSQAELDSSSEQKRFCAAERRNVLCVVASQDGRRGSLGIHLNALVHSSILDPGQHIVHELSPGRSAWLHLVQGEVTLGDLVLTTGDGAGFRAERAISLTTREETYPAARSRRTPSDFPGNGGAP